MQIVPSPSTRALRASRPDSGQRVQSWRQTARSGYLEQLSIGAGGGVGLEAQDTRLEATRAAARTMAIFMGVKLLMEFVMHPSPAGTGFSEISGTSHHCNAQ